MIPSKTEKRDLHFTKSQGDRTIHVKWDTSVPDRSHKVSPCNWKIWKVFDKD